MIEAILLTMLLFGAAWALDATVNYILRVSS